MSLKNNIMRKINILLLAYALFVFNLNIFAQFKQKSNGYIGIGTLDPKEQLQLGDRWTFHNGGTKIIGYNYTYNSEDKRIVTGYSSAFKFDSDGDLSFFVAPYGTAGTSITWKNPIEIKNNGYIYFEGISDHDLIFRPYSYSLALYPEYDLDGYLGTSSRAWGVANIYQLYRQYEYDATFKSAGEDVSIKNPLEKVLSLNAKLYVKKNNLKSTSLQNKVIGLDGEELEKVFPELVIKDDSTNRYGIDMDGMIPILIEALKEQQVQITALKNEVTNLNEIISLNSNIYPNPSELQANIELSIPANTKKAMIIIYNSEGKLVKELNIEDRGKSTITFITSNLASGIYSFNLMADGKIVSSSKFIKK